MSINLELLDGPPVGRGRRSQDDSQVLVSLSRKTHDLGVASTCATGHRGPGSAIAGDLDVVAAGVVTGVIRRRHFYFVDGLGRAHVHLEVKAGSLVLVGAEPARIDPGNGVVDGVLRCVSAAQGAFVLASKAASLSWAPATDAEQFAPEATVVVVVVVVPDVAGL